MDSPTPSYWPLKSSCWLAVIGLHLQSDLQNFVRFWETTREEWMIIWRLFCSSILSWNYLMEQAFHIDNILGKFCSALLLFYWMSLNDGLTMLTQVTQWPTQLCQCIWHPLRALMEALYLHLVVIALPYLARMAGCPNSLPYLRYASENSKCLV